MAKNAVFKRQSIDYLLSDMLPYEKGLHFTHLFFYKYLESEKNKYAKILKSTKARNNYFDPGWHSSPLSFNVKKKNRTLREISLINPLGLVESLIFTDLFSDELVGFFKTNKGFSLRSISKKQSMIYRNKRGNVIYYDTSNEQLTNRKKKQDKLMLETSGDFYNIGKFKTISSYLNSDEFHRNLEKYRFHLKIDIQMFFNSIYTHSFKWTISNEGYDSKSLKNSNSLPRNIDTFLQNLNGSKTNGILTGPEMFRTLAEYLLINIDNKILHEINCCNISEEEYCINRFIDDYFIFSNDKKIEQKIQRIVDKHLSDFQLSINQNKVSYFINEDFIPNQALLGFDSILNDLKLLLEINEKELKRVFKEITESFNPSLDPKIEEYNKILLKSIFSNKALNNKFYYSLKSKTLKIISENDNSSKTLLTSYILTTIINLFESILEADKIEGSSLKEKNIFYIIKYTIFLYNLNITYDSTKKITRIFQLVLRIFPLQKITIQNEIENSLYHLESNEVADWIDLILFSTSNHFNFTTNFIELVSKKVFELNNPLLLSSFIISVSSNRSNFPSTILTKANQVIENNILTINWSEFFEDNKSWWVFIFLSYPKLKTEVKEGIIEKIIENKKALDDSIKKTDKKVKSFEQNDVKLRRTIKQINNLREKLSRVDNNLRSSINGEIALLNRKKKEIEKINSKNVLNLTENLNQQLAKVLVYNFLLLDSKHFIEWDFNKDSYFQKFYFYTRKRTVFNPNFVDFNESY